MFEIDRLYITTSIENKQIKENQYFALFGGYAMLLNKKLFILNGEDELEDEPLEIYRNHRSEARAVSIKDHLIELEQNMNLFIKETPLIKQNDYDTFTYSADRYYYTNTEQEELINHYIQTAIKLLDIETIKQSMVELDKLAYYKAQKLFWEEKINDELSKIDEEDSDEYEE